MVLDGQQANDDGAECASATLQPRPGCSHTSARQPRRPLPRKTSTTTLTTEAG